MLNSEIHRSYNDRLDDGYLEFVYNFRIPDMCIFFSNPMDIYCESLISVRLTVVELYQP